MFFIASSVTIHQYPLIRNPDHSCPESKYTNLTVFTTELRDWLSEYRGYIQGGLPIILGETASTAEGGCNGLSNRFIAGFIFLYELGSVGESHIVQMNRQDLIGFSDESSPSNYAVLGSPGWINQTVSGMCHVFPWSH